MKFLSGFGIAGLNEARSVLAKISGFPIKHPDIVERIKTLKSRDEYIQSFFHNTKQVPFFVGMYTWFMARLYFTACNLIDALKAEPLNSIVTLMTCAYIISISVYILSYNIFLVGKKFGKSLSKKLLGFIYHIIFILAGYLTGLFVTCFFRGINYYRIFIKLPNVLIATIVFILKQCYGLFLQSFYILFTILVMEFIFIIASQKFWPVLIEASESTKFLDNLKKLIFQSEEDD